MATLTIELNANQSTFRPGDPIAGVAGWEFPEEPARWVEVRLYWHTLGKGNEDIVVADTVKFDAPMAVDAQVFSFVAPDGPFSYEGRLIEIAWGVELVAHKTKETAQLPLILSSTGEPVRIES